MSRLHTYSARIREGLQPVAWRLLAFLCLVSIDMVVVKPVAILAGIWLAGGLDLRRGLKDLPPFYLLAAALGLAQFLLMDRSFETPHLLVLGIGIGYWLMSALAFLILRQFVLKRPAQNTEATLSVWFGINALWSLGQLAVVMWRSGSLNPYGLDHPTWGNSTGDYIQGLLLGPCFINMFINAFFAVFFLYRGKYALATAAVIIACLTSSNFANLITIPVLLLLLFVLPAAKAKLTIAAQLAVFGIFYLLLSQGNLDYMARSLGPEKRVHGQAGARQDAAPDGIEISEVTDTTEALELAPLPELLRPNGKVVSVLQTRDYLLSSTDRLLLGAGIGNFSSRLALSASDLQSGRKSRLFLMLPDYVARDYRANHYRIFSAIYQLPPAYHSIRHFPSSFANQLAGEYGLLGVLAFVWGYVVFMLRKWKRLSWTLPMLLLAGGFLMFDYLFEYLSVMVFFELFYLLDLRRRRAAKTESV